MTLKRLTILSTAAFLALTSRALAHSGHGTMPDYASGFTHPLSGLDHVIAMVAVGVMAAQIGGRAIFLLPLAFMLAMTAGGAAGYAGAALPMVEQGIGLSVVVLSVAIAFGARMPLPAMLGLVGMFAVFHGNAHGSEAANVAAFLPYAGGFLAATALLHGLGITLGRSIDRLGANAALQLRRLVGAAGAVAGLVLLAG